MRPATRLTVALILLGWAAAVPAWAADFTIQRFHSDITVHTDASIDVVETIVVNFPVARHGIFRTIPFRYSTQNGGSVSVPITVTYVSQDGSPAQRSVRTQGDDVVIKIGDPRRTITGTHTYVVSYTAQAAVNFFSDHDELYWNATGSNWSGAAIPDASASVTLPGSIPPDERTAVCYTGISGSTAQNCTHEPTADGIRFTASDYLTVVVGWPTGIVTKPSDYDTVRASSGVGSDGVGGPLALRGGWLWFVLALNVLCLAGVAAWLIVRWRATGRDPAAPRTLVVQYDPPAGVSPAEAHAIVREGVSPNVDTTATIVDLAVRGWLTIVETPGTGVLGLGKRSQFSFHRLRDHVRDSTLKGHERRVLDGLFVDTHTPVGGTVELSELTETFPDRLGEIGSATLRQVSEVGFFVQNPTTVRTRYLVGGIIVAAIGVPLTIWWGLIGVPIAGLVVAIASRYFPKRTAEGVAALNHLRGFREYLEKAERYRIQWQEKESIFEQYLPYAMVFGVGEKWSKAFQGLTRRPPGWYQGTPGAAFNSLVLWSALSGMSTAVASSFTPASSGGSGFGGGGFSGGGFGGGGGGSW